MGINVGDKYIIEIGAVAELPDGKKKYFIKPFESLVFDRKGLEQLKRFDNITDALYQTGFKEGYTKAQARPDLKRLKDESYNKGYEDGAKNQDEVQYKKGYDAGRKDGFAYCRNNTELKDELKQEEYNKGFENGKLWAIDANAKSHQEYYDKGYNKGLDDASELMAYITQDFIDNCYPNDKGYNLYDLNAKYGLGRVLKDYKAYEEKKKVEEEIKVGDEVYLLDKTYPFVVTNVAGNTNVCLAESGKYTSIQRKHLTKTGRHFDEVAQLLDKLRGKEDD